MARVRPGYAFMRAFMGPDKTKPGGIPPQLPRRLFRRESVHRFKAIERSALRKLDMLDAAADIRTLTLLPGNRLERLKGNRKGQHSIRINDQWRVCFEWRNGHAYGV